MSESKNSSSFNTVALLGLVFITLKLCKIIDWSWWWVTSPFWIPTCLLLLAFIGGLVWAIIADLKK